MIIIDEEVEGDRRRAKAGKQERRSGKEGKRKLGTTSCRFRDPQNPTVMRGMADIADTGRC